MHKTEIHSRCRTLISKRPVSFRPDIPELWFFFHHHGQGSHVGGGLTHLIVSPRFVKTPKINLLCHGFQICVAYNNICTFAVLSGEFFLHHRRRNMGTRAYFGWVFVDELQTCRPDDGYPAAIRGLNLSISSLMVFHVFPSHVSMSNGCTFHLEYLMKKSRSSCECSRE